MNKKHNKFLESTEKILKIFDSMPEQTNEEITVKQNYLVKLDTIIDYAKIENEYVKEIFKKFIQCNSDRLKELKLMNYKLEKKITDNYIQGFTIERFLQDIKDPNNQIKMLYKIKDVFNEILMSKKIEAEPIFGWEIENEGTENKKSIPKMLQPYPNTLGYDTERDIKEKLKFIVDKIESLKFKLDSNKLEVKTQEKNITNKDISTTAKNRIIWKGSVHDIKELLKLLNERGLIDQESVKYSSAIIRDCFVKPDGKNFKYNNVRKSNVKGKSRNFHKVKDTVNSLK